MRHADLDQGVGKTGRLLVCCLLGGVIGVGASWNSEAQGGEETGAVAMLVSEIAAQQEQLVANQTQMEERLARVAEDVRVARIFASRVGGRGTP